MRLVQKGNIKIYSQINIWSSYFNDDNKRLLVFTYLLSFSHIFNIFEVQYQLVSDRH